MYSVGLSKSIDDHRDEPLQSANPSSYRSGDGATMAAQVPHNERSFYYGSGTAFLGCFSLGRLVAMRETEWITEKDI